MAFIVAISPNDVAQSAVEIPDALWATAEPQLRREADAKGYQLTALSYVPEAGEVDERCDDLAACLVWLSKLNANED